MYRCLPLGLVLTTSLSTLQASPSATPSPALSLEVNGAGLEKHLPSLKGRVGLLLVRPSELPIALQFPSDKAGTPIDAIPLDGGNLNGGNLRVLPTGKVLFTFSRIGAPGRYRGMVHTPLEQHLLEFYVVDSSHHPRQQRH